MLFSPLKSRISNLENTPSLGFFAICDLPSAICYRLSAIGCLLFAAEPISALHFSAFQFLIEQLASPAPVLALTLDPSPIGWEMAVRWERETKKT